MRFGFSVIALAALLGAGCLSPDPQPARPVEQQEIQEIERPDDEDAGPGLIKVTAADIQKNKRFRPSKDSWNKKGSTEVGDEGIEIDLGKVEKSTRVEVIFGNAHFYKLTFFNGSEQVGTSKAAPRVSVLRKKLVIRRVAVPRSAVEKGYDRILIQPDEDERRSVASVRVLPPAEAAKWDQKAKKSKRRKPAKKAAGAKAASGAAAKKAAPTKAPAGN